MYQIGMLSIDGFHGRTETRVRVIGETLTRFRIQAIERTRVAGRTRYLEPGETVLVPKYAIRLVREK
ncbi:MAG: hypothetical protein WBX25_13395 [Rhodomicrobium sp.]